MKLKLFSLFFIIVFFFNYSIEQSIETFEETTEISETTEEWSTPTPRPIPQRRTTTRPNRVSTPVLIAVPVTIAVVTLLIGYGLILYAVRTGENRVFFLTRTNEHV